MNKPCFASISILKVLRLEPRIYTTSPSKIYRGIVIIADAGLGRRNTALPCVATALVLHEQEQKEHDQPDGNDL
ncbi:MAG: hypothetical protein WCI51_13995 [Lentisphaerota bacterium]